MENFTTSVAAELASRIKDLLIHQQGNIENTTLMIVQNLPLLRKLAKQKNIAAQYILGFAYMTGKGTIQNYKQATRWFRQAAKQGDASAQFYLGLLVYRRGSPKNYTEAVDLFRLSAEQGHTKAQYCLGMAYYDGKGVQHDYEQALAFFHKIAEKTADNEDNFEIIHSRYCLGTMYKKGEGCNQDIEKAKKWFQEVFSDTFSEIDFGGTEPREGGPALGIYSYVFMKVHQEQGEIRSEKELVTLYRQLAQEILVDMVRIEEQEKAKQELEDVMAMFAHKFRGPLQSIQYNAEHSNQKQITLQAVQTMAGLLRIFSTIATDAQQLRLKLQQDMQGEGTILTVLEKALLPVIKQVLTIDNAKKIRQHYLGYAKKTGQVPATTTRKQWVQDYFQLEEQLQAAWEESFSALLTEPRLDKLVTWIEERFFPLEVTGFNNDTIHFERYGATESTLIIVMTEMLLNAVKYYSSKTNEPVKVDCQIDKEFAIIVCENPSSRDERRIDKGSQKGHKFLNIIAKNLQGHFPEPLPKNPYQLKWQIPMDLLVRN